MSVTRRAAVFLDRDGVINANRADYVRAWDQLEILPGVLAALAVLAASDFRVVVVTNQSSVGRMLLDPQVLEEIHARLQAEIQRHAGRIDAIYCCPHTPEAGCNCRKPRPGLLLRAAEELELDLSRSYLVGDAVTDLQAALAAGCQPVLVQTGRGQVQMHSLSDEMRALCWITADLYEAVQRIMVEEV